MQAIFSVVAIVVAITVPVATMLHDRKMRAAERAARAENLLVTLAGDVFPLAGEVDRLAEKISSHRDRPPIVGLGFDGTWFDGLKIQISQRLNDAMPLTLDMDAHLVDPLRQVVMGATAYNGFLENLKEAWPFDPAIWPEAMEGLERNRQMVKLYADALVRRYQYRVRRGG